MLVLPVGKGTCSLVHRRVARIEAERTHSAQEIEIEIETVGVECKFEVGNDVASVRQLEKDTYGMKGLRWLVVET